MSKFLTGDGLARAWQKIKEQFTLAFENIAEVFMLHTEDSSIHVATEDRTNWNNKIGTEFGIGAAELPYCADANTVTEAGLYLVDADTIGVPAKRKYILRHMPLSDTVAVQEAYYESIGAMTYRVRTDGAGVWYNWKVFRSDISAITIATNPGNTGTNCSASGEHLIYAGYKGDYYLAAVYRSGSLVAPTVTEIAAQGFVLDSVNTAGVVKVRHIATDQTIARIVRLTIGAAT